MHTKHVVFDIPIGCLFQQHITHTVFFYAAYRIDRRMRSTFWPLKERHSRYKGSINQYKHLRLSIPQFVQTTKHPSLYDVIEPLNFISNDQISLYMSAAHLNDSIKSNNHFRSRSWSKALSERCYDKEVILRCLGLSCLRCRWWIPTWVTCNKYVNSIDVV